MIPQYASVGVQEKYLVCSIKKSMGRKPRTTSLYGFSEMNGMIVR